MNEIIREIQKKDRKKCIDIIKICLLEVNSKNYSPKFIKNLVKSYSKNFLKRPGIYTLILEKNGEIIGTGSISEQGQIRDVFIEVKNHRKGFGTKLMKELEREAKRKKFKTIYLYSAISAVHFYEKLRYVKLDQLDHDDQNIEIRMGKNLELD